MRQESCVADFRTWTSRLLLGYIAGMRLPMKNAVGRCVAVAIYLLLASCASGDEPPVDEPALRTAVGRALPLLQKGAVGHRENRECFSCHNQGIPILALTTARDHGFEIDAAELQKQIEHVGAFLGSKRDGFREGKGTGGQVDTAGYALVALSAAGWKPDETTAAVTEYLLLHQQDSNRWKTGSNRPPSEASQFTTNFVGIRGLKAFATAEQSERSARRIAQVCESLGALESKDTEDRVFRLLALKEADRPKAELEVAAKELVSTQRADGGWSQLDTLDSDAYATGTALVALHQAGGMPTSDPVYQRALQFLLKTQLEDGSWHVKSRSKAFQPYFETGFPHGKDQFISCAASGWATMALTLACDKKK
jgi:hypothetical protein